MTTNVQAFEITVDELRRLERIGIEHEALVVAGRNLAIKLDDPNTTDRDSVPLWREYRLILSELGGRREAGSDDDELRATLERLAEVGHQTTS